MKKEEFVPIDQPGLVELVTIEVWKGKTHYYQDEHSARWNKATHVKCEGCDQYCEKSRVYCITCSEQRELERYLSKELVEWDQEAPVYSEAIEEYFFDEGEIAEWLEDNEYEGDLRLVLCEPVPKPQLDLENFLSDYFEEVDLREIDEEVVRATDALNAALEKLQILWMPGKKRVSLGQAP